MKERDKMQIYKEDVKDIALWIIMILFFFGIAYLANGGSNIIIFLFVMVYGIIAARGLWQFTVKYLEEYFAKKGGTPKQ